MLRFQNDTMLLALNLLTLIVREILRCDALPISEYRPGIPIGWISPCIYSTIIVELIFHAIQNI